MTDDHHQPITIDSMVCSFLYEENTVHTSIEEGWSLAAHPQPEVGSIQRPRSVQDTYNTHRMTSAELRQRKAETALIEKRRLVEGLEAEVRELRAARATTALGRRKGPWDNQIDLSARYPVHFQHWERNPPPWLLRRNKESIKTSSQEGELQVTNSNSSIHVTTTSLAALSPINAEISKSRKKVFGCNNKRLYKECVEHENLPRIQRRDPIWPVNVDMFNQRLYQDALRHTRLVHESAAKKYTSAVSAAKKCTNQELQTLTSRLYESEIEKRKAHHEAALEAALKPLRSAKGNKK